MPTYFCLRFVGCGIFRQYADNLIGVPTLNTRSVLSVVNVCSRQVEENGAKEADNGRKEDTAARSQGS